MGGTRPGGTEPRPLTHAVRPAEALALPRLMLVSDRGEAGGRDLVEVLVAAVAGGVGLVQVRERDLPETDVADLLRRLLARLEHTPARVLVNGHPDLARALGVGLHLPASAPRPAEPPPLYGRAVHDEAEARRALAEAVSYVVVGPVFATASKPGHPGAGMETLSRLVAAVAPTPVYAIGGLTPERVTSVLAAGAYGVAVRSAILSAPDPKRAARAFAAVLPAV